MDIFGEAYFVERPRTIDDLRVPHLIEQRRPMQIAKIIRLSTMDYDNFIYDMLADRRFIEENHTLCSQGKVWKGIFVCRKKSCEGIVVIPRDKCYVGWAAFYSL